MAEVNLTAAFSSVPAGDAEAIKRLLVEMVEQIARDDGTFDRAKLVFTESDERCGLTAELDGVKKEGVPLPLDLDHPGGRADVCRGPGAARRKPSASTSGRCRASERRRRHAAVPVSGLRIPRPGRRAGAQGRLALLLQPPRGAGGRARPGDRRRPRPGGGAGRAGRRARGRHRHPAGRGRDHPGQCRAQRRDDRRAARRLLRAGSRASASISSPATRRRCRRRPGAGAATPRRPPTTAGSTAGTCSIGSSPARPRTWRPGGRLVFTIFAFLGLKAAFARCEAAGLGRRGSSPARSSRFPRIGYERLEHLREIDAEGTLPRGLPDRGRALRHRGAPVVRALIVNADDFGLTPRRERGDPGRPPARHRHQHHRAGDGGRRPRAAGRGARLRPGPGPAHQPHARQAADRAAAR